MTPKQEEIAHLVSRLKIGYGTDITSTFMRQVVIECIKEFCERMKEEQDGE